MEDNADLTSNLVGDNGSWILQASERPPAEQRDQGVSRNKDGWIRMNRMPHQVTTDGKYFLKKNTQFDGGVEFRIGVTPTPENIAKAYSVLFPLLSDEKAPLLAKFVDPMALKEANFAEWVPERGEKRHRDQRGKEICFYVTWNTSRSAPATPSLTAEEYKAFMLKALKALIDAKVEGIAYYPSIDGDRPLRAEPPHLVTYLDYTSTDRSIWQHQANYAPFGFTNPLKDIRITRQNYLDAGITAQNLEDIRFNQEKYLRSHFYSAIRSFAEELQSEDLLTISDLENKELLDQRKIAKDNIAKCIAQNPSFFTGINTKQLLNHHNTQKIIALGNTARFLMMEQKQIEASQNGYRDALIEADPNMTTNRNFPQPAIDWLLEHPKSSVAIAIVGILGVFIPTIIVGLTYWWGKSTRKPVDDFLGVLEAAKQEQFSEQESGSPRAKNEILHLESEQAQQIAKQIMELEAIQFNPTIMKPNEVLKPNEVSSMIDESQSTDPASSTNTTPAITITTESESSIFDNPALDEDYLKKVKIKNFLSYFYIAAVDKKGIVITSSTHSNQQEEKLVIKHLKPFINTDGSFISIPENISITFQANENVSIELSLNFKNNHRLPINQKEFNDCIDITTKDEKNNGNTYICTCDGVPISQTLSTVEKKYSTSKPEHFVPVIHSDQQKARTIPTTLPDDSQPEIFKPIFQAENPIKQSTSYAPAQATDPEIKLSSYPKEASNEKFKRILLNKKIRKDFIRNLEIIIRREQYRGQNAYCLFKDLLDRAEVSEDGIFISKTKLPETSLYHKFFWESPDTLNRVLKKMIGATSTVFSTYDYKLRHNNEEGLFFTNARLDEMHSTYVNHAISQMNTRSIKKEHHGEITYDEIHNLLMSEPSLKLPKELSDFIEEIPENASNQPIQLHHRKILIQALNRLRNTAKDNPVYFLLTELEKLLDFPVEMIYWCINPELLSKIEQHPDILEEAQLAIEYTKETLEFYQINYRDGTLLLSMIEKIMQLPNIEKRFSPPLGDQEKCGIYETIVTDIIRERLQTEENEILHQMNPVDSGNINFTEASEIIDYLMAELSYDPDSYVLKKLLLEAQIYQEMQKLNSKNSFPFSTIWQFVIDADRRGYGPYIFDDEPGYIVGALSGLLHALRTKNARKENSWYIKLHDTCIDNVYRSIGLGDTKNAEEFLRTHNHNKPKLFDQGVRNENTSYLDFGLSNLKKDKEGMKDFKSLNRKDWLYIDPNTQNLVAFKCKSSEEINKRMSELFAKYETLLANAADEADRLLIHLWLCREMEIHHFFTDANGRTCVLAAISMVANDGLPLMLFDDPNVFDLSGPKPLFEFALNAMYNYCSFAKLDSSKIDLLAEQSKEKFKETESWKGIIEKIQRPKTDFLTAVPVKSAADELTPEQSEKAGNQLPTIKH